jgi:hypothetical protein
VSPRNELEEWLTELPPLDGGEDESEENEAIADDFVPDDGQDPSLDDAAADDLDVDEGVEIAEVESAESDDEHWQADVGEPELDVTDGEPSAIDGDGAAEPSADGDFDIDDDLPASDDDAGEEGTTDPIEHSLDEDLPALDADDEGDFEDELMLDVRIPAASRSSVRWADALWEERTALARELTWVLEEDEVASLCVALASAQEVVAAITERGALLVLPGETDAPGRIAHVPDKGSWLFALSGPGQPVLWAATRAGELAKSGDLGATWTRCPALGRPILTIGTRDDGALTVLARKADAVELLTSSDGARWFAQRVSIELNTDEGRSIWMTHRGPCSAIGDAGGVSVSRDGRHFVRIPGSSGATAGAFAGPSPEAPLLLAGMFESDEVIQLLRVPHEGDVEIVGEVKPPLVENDDPEVLALVWHDATETLRVAFASHLVTWGPAKRRA